MKEPSQTTAQPLTLVSQADAETEKQIDESLKTLRLAVNGRRRGESLLYAYAIIAGTAASRLAEITPHGRLRKLLEDKFPDVSKSQLQVWRDFAKDVLPHLAKNPIVGILTAPVLGKKMIPEKSLNGLQDAVKAVLKGATMVQFHKASTFCGEVEGAGGFRADAVELAKWLKSQHPELPADTAFNTLLPELQEAFKAYYFALPKEGPSEERIAQQFDDTRQSLRLTLSGGCLKRFNADQLQEVELMATQIAAKARDLRGSRKTKS